MAKKILSGNQIVWAYKKWCEGYTHTEIAEALFVSRALICRELKRLDMRKSKKPLIYSEDDIDNNEIKDIGDLSDGYHTFNQLYHQRLMLFSVIVNSNKDKAWKTYRHEDGELCFNGGWFLVTIDTPRGAYGYHFENKYWDLFDCVELDRAKHWDGYTEEDVDRLFSLLDKEVIE